jgi:spore maturation protein CgeB
MGNRNKMKVLITGSQWHDNSSQITAHGFREIGCQTEIFYDNPKNWNLTASKITSRTPLKKYSIKFEEWYKDRVGQLFLAAVEKFKPDFIFVIAGLYFSNRIIKQIREKYKISIANFVVDDPAFCSRTLMYDLSAYSEVFVIDRSWMPVLEFFNPGHIHYLPHAGDIENFKPLGIKKDVDVAFGGTVALRMPNGPSGYLRAEILNVLAETGFKIKAYVPGITEAFREFPALKNIEYYDGYKSHEELNKLYNQAKIVLSIHSPQLKSGVSPRVFDVALAGTFQLVEFKSELPELFTEGLKCFKNLNELVDFTKYYLTYDEEREELAKKCNKLAIKNHTFKSRAQYILSKI